MSLTKKVALFILIALGGILIFLQYKFKSEITITIDEKLPPNTELNYAQINANVFSGKIELDSLYVKVLDNNENIITSLTAQNLKITGFNLWQFLLNKSISVDLIVFNSPKIEHNQQEGEQVQNDTTFNSEFDKSILIENISFVNGALKVNKKDSLLVNINSINFDISEVHSNSEKIKEKIPFEFKNFNLKIEQFFFNMSSFEDLKIETLAIENEKLSLENLNIDPKFTKEELSAKIVTERDHLQLHVPELKIHKFNFGFKNNTFFIKADTSKIRAPNLIVYRDKRITDDVSVKKMYSTMLRNLSFDMTIDELKIKKGFISYAERVEQTDKAGEIFFTNVNASIKNLSNTYSEGVKTEIITTSNFMNEAALNLDINFDTNNKEKLFSVSGQFKNFNASAANTFFESNLNVKAEGEIEDIYFTFNGNNFSSKGDLKMKYNDFSFKILNKENRVNKILTAFGNIFVNDGSKTDDKGFRHGQIEVDRNQTKSFFNYLWINVQDGLISTLTGNGEKK